jgi:Protein of unknown function (DUF3501)
MSGSGLLTLDDIADQRAYEREREAFRAQVIAVKKLRRISVGPVISLTFENRLTMRFQVQEMARAEKLTTDRQIQHELDVYNRLLPTPGELSATLFVELTSEEELRSWLPRLVGVERACEVRIGTGPGAHVVPSIPEEEHDANLTRAEVTAAVHYVRFRFTDQEIHAFTAQPVALAVNLAAYPEGVPGTELGKATRAELARDLHGE